MLRTLKNKIAPVLKLPVGHLHSFLRCAGGAVSGPNCGQDCWIDLNFLELTAHVYPSAAAALRSALVCISTSAYQLPFRVITLTPAGLIQASRVTILMTRLRLCSAHASPLHDFLVGI
jgi:hypothetical protein